MSLRAKVLAVSTSLLVLLVAWPVTTHYRAKGKVEAYRRELKAKGEKLEVAELAPSHSADDFTNSANLLMAVSHLFSPSPNFSNIPPAMKFVAPGKAMVSWQQTVLPTDQSSNVWPGLIADLSSNREVLEDIRSVLHGSVLAFDVDYSQGPATPLSHLSRLKGVAQWLSASATLDLHERRSNEAWTNLIALSSLVEGQSEERVMLSELVHIAIATIAANSTWEALQASEINEQHLKTVQTSWESISFLTRAEGVLAMERAWGKEGFARARNSYAEFDGGPWSGGTTANLSLSALAEFGKEVVNDPKESLKSVVHRYPGYWGWTYWLSYEDELVGMQLFQAYLEAVRRAVKEQMLSPAFKQVNQDVSHITQANPNAGKWMGLPSDYLRPFLSRVASIEIHRALLVTAIALKRYQLKHGTYPAELGLLKPKYLREVPRDPIDGLPLRYRLNPNGSFVMYSVGQDGVDNGGDPTPSPDAPREWYKARDAVWPQPASAEEVKADFDKLKRRR